MNELQRRQLIRFWNDGARDAWKTASILFAERRYAHALFFCHLAIEKRIKALIVATTKEQPPYSHDLKALALKTKLTLTDEQKIVLDTISTFNVSARYDSIKKEFSARATRMYATEWFEHAEKIFLWLKKKFPKK